MRVLYNGRDISARIGVCPLGRCTLPALRKHVQSLVISHDLERLRLNSVVGLARVVVCLGLGCSLRRFSGRGGASMKRAEAQAVPASKRNEAN